MKNIFLFTLLLIISKSSQAQTEFMLRFDHRLDGKTFSLDQEATSSSGTKYKLTRLQYYISGIKITHDGGQELALNNVYLFVDPSKLYSKEFSLGELSNITTVEKIEFAVGVDPASNHSDPASYPGNHPLAPKNPPMDWGWTAGYIYISLAGKAASHSGSFLDYVNIEGLGDSNYKTKTYPAKGSLENGKVYIDMLAEYNKLLEGIEVAGGVSNHGEFGSAANLVDNATSIVFSPSTPLSTKSAYNNAYSEVVYTPDEVLIRYSFPAVSKLQFKLYDSNGKTIQESNISTREGTVNINNQIQSGNYFYSLVRENEIVSSGKIMKK